ncbi:hypothetical protein SCLCIDRAFT_1216217 [Scleroderma citrinum Foug A]|uniref:Uncharacterized protein n=1 Tax=Scleroderma citrinum Foug A TaxID=1036808 RepID=A0A0C3DZI6_9AGAM|nr:hypothetical protein SCLCIDRAFT_1216217 [Scleroderma citrinum Foug A]
MSTYMLQHTVALHNIGLQAKSYVQERSQLFVNGTAPTALPVSDSRHAQHPGH